MSVPLGHRNHKSSRSNKLSFTETYSQSCKIYKNCLALSLDGKSIIRLDPSFHGELTIPEGVETVKRYAFDDCKNVTVIKFPKSFRSFDMGSYFGCYAKVLIFKNLPIFPDNLFDHFECKLKEIIVDSKEDVEKLRSQFRHLSCNITVKTDRWTYRRTMLDKSVYDCGKKDKFGVLYSEDGKILLNFNKKLRSYVIPEGVNVIANSAFQCSQIEKIVMPQSMRIIGEYAFFHCDSLTTVVFNKGLRHIFDYAFNWCSKLQTVKIPNIVLGNGVFLWCDSLSSMELPSGFRVISPKSFYKTNIKEIQLPDTLEIIMHDAFIYSAVENLYIPSSVSFIGRNAFSECRSLKRINIPIKVEKLDWFLFDNCTNLKEVFIEGSPKLIEQRVFIGCSQLESIYVAEDYVDKLKEMIPDFKDCIKAISPSQTEVMQARGVAR